MEIKKLQGTRPTDITHEDINMPAPDLSHLTDLQQRALKLYLQHGFNVTKICAEIGISRPAFYYWKHNIPAFKAAIEEYDEALLDFSREILIGAVKGGSLKAAMFIVQHLDKRFNRQLLDITSNGNSIGNINIQIIKSDDAKS
jgi:predicted DNA-binding protein YlxM (UPF0122 family)